MTQKENGNPKIVTNLLESVAIRAKVKNVQCCMIPTISRMVIHQSPLQINYTMTQKLHWVILLVNDITDRYHRRPMYEQQFNTYVNEKYDNPDGVHHYEISQSSGDIEQK